MDMSSGDEARTPAENLHLSGGMPREPASADPLFPAGILGLRSPQLPGELRSALADTPPHRVEIDFRDPLDAADDRFLTIAARPAQRRRSSRASTLEAALWLTRARLADPGKVVAAGVPAPALSAVEHASVLVEERRVACALRRLGDLWAIEVHLSAEVMLPWPGATGTAVTVVARGIDLGDVSLTAVTDLEPFVTAPTHGPGLPGSPRHFAAAFEPVTYGAIQALVLAHLREGPDTARFSDVHSWMLELHALWAAAHRAQMHFAGQEPEAAAQALTTLTNHMRALAVAAPWWLEAGAEAIAESIRYSVFASDVPSLPAQEQWRLGVSDSTTTRRWLHAWQQWYSLRAPRQRDNP